MRRNMNNFHNFGTVFRFEVIRTLKKKSFWLMSLLFPVMFGLIAGIMFFSNKTTEEAINDAQKQQFSFGVTDASGVIQPEILATMNAERIASKQDGIQRVASGSIDAYFYYPPDLSRDRVEIFGKDVGLFDNGRYQGVAKMILDQSATLNVAGSVRSVLQNTVSYQSTVYRNGTVYDGMRQLIAPAIFLVLFYIMITTFGNQMLTSTTEEKENRVIEVILTTIEARTLIIGKIISLIILGFIQMTIILTPVIIGYSIFHDKLSLPSIDLSSIPLDPTRIGIGAAIFVASFLLFTGLLVTVGAAAPTAKEAGGFFGIVMVLIFGPLYASSIFVSSPDTIFVKVLSFFPLTSPIPLMLRNAVGNLSVIDALIAIALIMLLAVIVLSIAVRVFRYGALEYNRRLSLKEIFRSR